LREAGRRLGRRCRGSQRLREHAPYHPIHGTPSGSSSRLGLYPFPANRRGRAGFDCYPKTRRIRPTIGGTTSTHPTMPTRPGPRGNNGPMSAMLTTSARRMDGMGSPRKAHTSDQDADNSRAAIASSDLQAFQADARTRTGTPSLRVKSAGSTATDPRSSELRRSLIQSGLRHVRASVAMSARRPTRGRSVDVLARDRPLLGV
jgi:hypothetical protein